MSIKKLAKSINNLADAIRYHADGGQTAPKYDGRETEHALQPLAAEMAVDALHAADKKLLAEVDRWPLTEAEENYVDPYDADHKIVTPQPPTIISPDVDITISAKPKDRPGVQVGHGSAPTPEVNDPDFMAGGASLGNAPKADVPGWQTLTVEDLDRAPASVDVDASGLPWDERIHSGGKTKLVDDTWRLKRGVPGDEYEAVVAELKKLMAIPGPQPADNAPLPPVDNLPKPPAPPAPQPVDSSTPTVVDNLPAFIKAVTGAAIDKDTVLAAVKSAGLENVMQLGARPDLISGVARELGL